MIMSKYLKQDKSEPMSKYQRQPTEPFVPSVGSPSIREVNGIISSVSMDWIVIF